MNQIENLYFKNLQNTAKFKRKVSRFRRKIGWKPIFVSSVLLINHLQILKNLANTRDINIFTAISSSPKTIQYP